MCVELTTCDPSGQMFTPGLNITSVSSSHHLFPFLYSHALMPCLRVWCNLLSLWIQLQQWPWEVRSECWYWQEVRGCWGWLGGGGGGGPWPTTHCSSVEAWVMPLCLRSVSGHHIRDCCLLPLAEQLHLRTLSCCFKRQPDSTSPSLCISKRHIWMALLWCASTQPASVHHDSHWGVMQSVTSLWAGIT